MNCVTYSKTWGMKSKVLNLNFAVRVKARIIGANGIGTFCGGTKPKVVLLERFFSVAVTRKPRVPI